MTHIPVRVSATAVILLSLVMGACGAGETPPEKQASAPEPPVVERGGGDKPDPVASQIDAGGEAVSVQELTLGDRACYMQVKSAQGESREEMAVMELCERRELIGRTVRLSHETGSIAAESCQGNPECAESETVQLVSDVEVLP
ncbi:MAG: hypothetical protein ACR2HE_13910 [Casimicrobiaceae bacterium]